MDKQKTDFLIQSLGLIIAIFSGIFLVKFGLEISNFISIVAAILYFIGVVIVVTKWL